MTKLITPRRNFIAQGAALATFGLAGAASGQTLAPTLSMRGGSDNYRPGAPIVERIGGGGF